MVLFVNYPMEYFSHVAHDFVCKIPLLACALGQARARRYGILYTAHDYEPHYFKQVILLAVMNQIISTLFILIEVIIIVRSLENNVCCHVTAWSTMSTPTMRQIVGQRDSALARELVKARFCL